jgi:hypothetical protein
MTEELKRIRRPGSVRLTDEQYAEMERLGLDSESAYVKYKLNGAQDRLQLIRSEEPNTEEAKPHPSAVQLANHQEASGPSELTDKLAIQRLTLENRRLQERLDTLSDDKEATLDGIPQRVNHLLQ